LEQQLKQTNDFQWCRNTQHTGREARKAGIATPKEMLDITVAWCMVNSCTAAAIASVADEDGVVIDRVKREGPLKGPVPEASNTVILLLKRFYNFCALRSNFAFNTHGGTAARAQRAAQHKSI
jgi:hypothetical protein